VSPHTLYAGAGLGDSQAGAVEVDGAGRRWRVGEDAFKSYVTTLFQIKRSGAVSPFGRRVIAAQRAGADLAPVVFVAVQHLKIPGKYQVTTK